MFNQDSGRTCSGVRPGFINNQIMAKDNSSPFNESKSTMAVDGTLSWDKALAKYQSFKVEAQRWGDRYNHLGSLKYVLQPCECRHAIHQPRERAAEYGRFAGGFHNGCPNGCTYCFLKLGPSAGILGGSVAKLKKCFKSEAHAIEVYFKELFGGNGGTIPEEIRKHGIFFTFTSDPGLPETFPLNAAVISETVKLRVPVLFLTKMTDWTDSEIGRDLLSIPEAKENLTIGFTLTGRDDLELKASPNKDRIAALRRLHDDGFKTFSSMEPVISCKMSLSIIKECLGFVDLFKVGLESQRKYDKEVVLKFVDDLAALPEKPWIYLKDSIINLIGRERGFYGKNFVDADFRA